MTFVINSIPNSTFKTFFNWIISRHIHGKRQFHFGNVPSPLTPPSTSALDGSEFLPGLLGLNNIKENDSLNAALQLLLRVRPLRDYFLRPSNYADPKGAHVLCVSFKHFISLFRFVS